MISYLHKKEKVFFRLFLGQVYRTLREIYVRMRGTSFFERKWRIRGLTEIQKGFSNLSHPHRRWLMDELRQISPFDSILEIGCGYGPNVIVLAQSFPGVRVVGTDINPISIREGNTKLKEKRIVSAQLHVSKADNGSPFLDKSFDIVFTDALLLYLGPDKIRNVVREMKRIARKAIVLVELHDEDGMKDPFGNGCLTPDGWVRNYKNLLHPLFPVESLSLKKIPASVWPEGRWPSNGFIVVGRLQPSASTGNESLHGEKSVGGYG